MRKIHTKRSAHAQRHLDLFYLDTIMELEDCIKNNDIVIIGMALNPHVKRAKKAIEEQKFQYTYKEYGGYFSAWKQRLAIKMWSGWPTFPQIFVRGTLIGGASDTVTAIKNGLFQELKNE